MDNYPLSIFIFRRDLRLVDNTALNEALARSKQVLCCFIFDKNQLEANPYKSDFGLQFMLHSLQAIDTELAQQQAKLYFFYGLPEKVLEQLIRDQQPQAIFINRDYTPYARTRDQSIRNLCQRYHIAFHVFADALLTEPEEVLKDNQQPYQIFTPFFSKAATLPVAKPRKRTSGHFYTGVVPHTDRQTFLRLLKKDDPAIAVKGGRNEGLSLLAKVKEQGKYRETRNYPALDATTHLSAHNKFGTISIREFYYQVINHFPVTHTLISELYWRDFFTHVAWHFPYVFGHAFHRKYDKIAWSANQKKFSAWCEGMTGFPIVDAGMRQMNATGFMHNRVRMITASFLCKDLHIDWRWGERYFAQKLVDYDPSVNNGNWQWAASTGCDAQPYFRIFNPWLQQKKYDADCLYIKRWIPELAHFPPKAIHTLATHYVLAKTNYPQPIVDHAVESQKTKLIYAM